MDWDSNILEKYEKIMKCVPQEFEAVAKEMIKKAAETNAANRNFYKVEEEDLVEALLSITPESFKPRMFEEIKDVGIDIEKYAEIPRVEKIWKDVPRYLHANTLHLLWQLTDRCNTRCVHCRVDSGYIKKEEELSTKEIFRLIDNVIDSWDYPDKKFVLNFTGGEPLLRDDIYDILAYAHKKAAPKGHMIAFASNGLTINDEVARKLRDNGVGLIFISLDSTNPEINDLIRGRKGAHGKQLAAIEACKKAGIIVIISCTVMKQNFTSWQGLKKLADDKGVFFYATGIIQVGRAHEYWDEVGLTNEQYRELYYQKYANVIEKMRRGETEQIPLMECFDMVPFMEMPKTDVERRYIEWGVGCQSCKCVMGIGVKGEVYPCEFVTQTVLGDLKHQTFKEIYELDTARAIRERKTRHGKCATCHHLDMCGGGCLLHTETVTGDMLGSLPYCWHDNADEHA